jgi:hypothetical protein
MAQPGNIEKCVLLVQRMRLSIWSLESLTRKFVEGSEGFATAEKFGDYFDSFSEEIRDLGDEITQQRRRLLESGVQVSDEWLTFPIKIAFSVATEYDRRVIQEDPATTNRWRSIDESLGVCLERLRYDKRFIDDTNAHQTSGRREPDKPEKRRIKANDAMQAALATEFAKVVGYSIDDWAKHTGFAKSTIHDTATWKSLSLLREKNRAEHAIDRSRNGKKGSRRK